MVDERWGEEGVGCFFDEWIFNFLFFFLVSAAGALSGGEERGEWPRACLGGVGDGRARGEGGKSEAHAEEEEGGVGPHSEHPPDAVDSPYFFPTRICVRITFHWGCSPLPP